MTHKKKRSRPDLSGPQPFAFPPVVLFSAQAASDLERIVYLDHRISPVAVHERLCSQVRSHGVGLVSERVSYDRHRAVVSGMELMYDLLDEERLMVVSVRTVGSIRKRKESVSAQAQGDGRGRRSVSNADVSGGPGWSGGDLV